MIKRFVSWYKFRKFLKNIGREERKRKRDQKIKDFLRGFIFWPVYFEVYEMDCDCYEVTKYVRFRSWRAAMKAYDLMHSHAEGPIHFYQVTRKCYLKHREKLFARDRVGEAFDNGNSSPYFV